jgi:hypothetical protein
MALDSIFGLDDGTDELVQSVEQKYVLPPYFDPVNIWLRLRRANSSPACTDNLQEEGGFIPKRRARSSPGSITSN